MLRRHHPFILLLCLCALALRTGGAHVHVALDHREAPHEIHHEWHHDANTLHTVHAEHDTNSSTHQHDGADHDDSLHAHAEVSLDSKALSKKNGGSLDPQLLLFVVTLCALLPAAGRRLQPALRSFLPTADLLIHLRPPLRGPPAHA